MPRLRSALFLDFDNIFGGLLALDRAAAIRLATDPLSFLQRLARYGLAGDSYRDLLVRRAYLNPAGWVVDSELGNDSHRLYLQKFRPNLTKAGFEVIDCPALTSGHKNAADIRIVIDVLTTLDQRTTYDEILVASSDADFTPLLQRIRALDRRTTIITAGQTAPAYAAVADTYLDEETLIDLVSSEDPDDDATGIVGPTGAGHAGRVAGASPVGSARAAVAPGPSPGAEAVAEARRRATDVLVRQVAAAEAPVKLAEVGNLIHHQVGSGVVKSTGWFGSNSLSGFVTTATEGRLHVAQHVVWDPERHEPPGVDGMPQMIEQVCAITDLPRLPSDRWAALFEALATYARTHTFKLTEATAWSRDELSRAGTPVGRQAIGFVVRGAMYAGIRLDAEPPPDGRQLRDGFLRTIVERARSAGLDLDDDAQPQLAAWLEGGPDGGAPVDEGPGGRGPAAR